MTAFAVNPEKLGISMLNQDPSIRALSQLPLITPSLPGDAPGPIPGLALGQSRMAFFYHADESISAAHMYAIVRSATPAILNKLKERGVIYQAKRVGALYGIDPINIIAPIVAEAAFNPYSFKNEAQNIAASIMKFAKWNSRIAEILDRSGAENCRSLANLYIRLNCAHVVTNAQFFKTSGIFKDPSLQTYGIGQFSPLRAMMLSDLMFYVSGFERFDEKNLSSAFSVVLDDGKVLHAIAANAVMVISAYKRIAGVDLTSRPDLVATLYNVGNEVRNAENLRSLRAPSSSATPRNNYFGRYIFEVEDLLREAVR